MVEKEEMGNGSWRGVLDFIHGGRRFLGARGSEFGRRRREVLWEETGYVFDARVISV